MLNKGVIGNCLWRWLLELSLPGIVIRRQYQ